MDSHVFLYVVGHATEIRNDLNHNFFDTIELGAVMDFFQNIDIFPQLRHSSGYRHTP